MLGACFLAPQWSNNAWNTICFAASGEPVATSLNHITTLGLTTFVWISSSPLFVTNQSSPKVIMQGHYPVWRSFPLPWLIISTMHTSQHILTSLNSFCYLYFLFLSAEITERSMRLLCQVYCSTPQFPVAVGSGRKLEEIQRTAKPLFILALRRLPCVCSWTWFSLKRLNNFLLQYASSQWTQW